MTARSVITEANSQEEDSTTETAPRPTGVRRSEFLKVLGGGAAATTMLGCASEKVEKLIPYFVSPDQTVPGVSDYYATTCRECSAGCGVIAETRDGRTIKLEGNPEHPVNRGALCARGQAALQGLYNPDRYRGPMERKKGDLQSVTRDDELQIFAQQLEWADARADHNNAPRLIYVGPRRSLTGLNADQWIDCKPGSEMAVVRMLAGQVSPQAASQATGVSAEILNAFAHEFNATTPSLVIGGGGSADALDVALAVNALNQARGNVGVTIKPNEGNLGFDRMASPAELRALAERMNAGGVSMLMVRGANPVFTLPKSVGFAAALAKVPFKVSFSSYPDDTTQLADLILPDHHSLEQWGDAEPMRGTVSLQQPTMDPVFDTRATSDVLIAVAQKDPANAAKYPTPDYRSLLISRFAGGAAGLAAALPRGFAAGSLSEPTTARPVPAIRPGTALEQSKGNMYLVLYPHPFIGDGRGANKPWLQEIPDPVTKICWQTVAEMHPLTADRLDLANGDMISVQTAAGTLTVPILRYPGVQKDTIAIATGRGQQNAGRYAKAGQNPLDILPLAEDRAGGLAYVATKANVSKSGGFAHIVTTEGSARQHGRGVGQAIAIADLRAGRPGHDTGASNVTEVAPPGVAESPMAC